MGFYWERRPQQVEDRGDPMDVDINMMRHGGTSHSRIPGRFKLRPKGINREKERRKKENLYYIYRKSGYRAREYKSKA